MYSTANDPETANDPKMDLKWYFTQLIPKVDRKWMPEKLRNRIDFMGLIMKRNFFLSASEEKGKEDATSLLSTEEYKAGHPLRNFDFSLKC